MSMQAMSWAKYQTAGNPIAKAILITLSDYTNEDGESWVLPEDIYSEVECSEDEFVENLRLLTRGGLVALRPGFYELDPGELPESKFDWRSAMAKRGADHVR